MRRLIDIHRASFFRKQSWAFAFIVLSLVGCRALPTDSPKVAENSAFYQVGFSPKRAGGQAIEVVLSAIDSARQSIHMAAYSLTSDKIANALVRAQARGVEVKIVADKRDNDHSPHSVVKTLIDQGIAVRLNGRYAILHHKFMVIDGMGVQTGSFNYSASAELRNAENALWLRFAPELAQRYIQEWQRLWDEAENSQ